MEQLLELVQLLQKMFPYTIVGGVPAKTIKKRFSEENISALLEIQWWNWSEERIARNIGVIQSGNSEQLKQSM